MKRRDFLALSALAGGLLRFALAQEGPGALPPSFSLHGSMREGLAPQRLLAAGPPAAVLLYCLAPQSLLGWPFQLNDAAREALLPASRSLPHLGRLSGRGSTLSLEKLLALAPDLVLDTGTLNDLYRSDAERTAQQTRLPYLLIDGDLNLSPSTFLHLGHLLGVEERGRALAGFAQNVLDAAQAVRQAGPGPSFYLARGADGLETATAGSIHAQALELCGWRNVAPALGGSGLGRVSLEQVLAWNPDYLFTHDPVLHQGQLQSGPWRALRAVREQRTVLAPSTPFGWLDQPPGVNRLLGVHWITSAMQPGSRPAIWRRSLREAGTLLYGHPPTEAALDLAAALHP